MAKYEPVMGLEIHAELNTRTKMFCDSLNDPDEKHPNVNICPVCMGHPGTLPVINQEAVRKVIKVGLALGGEIPNFSQFDRKNYFYPDLPKGYQISQYEHPLVRGGELKLKIKNDPFDSAQGHPELYRIDEKVKSIRIRRIHLEEDTGRLIHGQKARSTLVDFNRAGVPLMELVTEPDFRSGEEVRKFGEELQLILRYLGVSDADMQKGEMRVEVNVSIRPNDQQIETNDNRIILKEESYRLMGLLFEIQNKLGSVYKEKNYQDAIEEVLRREQVLYEREKHIRLKLDDKEISEFIVDFLVDSKILLEVKATKFITQEDIRQTLRYIRELGVPLGIIVNFRASKLEYKRLINPAFGKDSIKLDGHSSDSSLGTKVEIKNINSFKFAEDAVNYEIKRQTEILEKGEAIKQETRGWNENKKETFSQRSKESAHDYRYFPEPDLPPLTQLSAISFQLAAEIPELPQAKRDRFKNEYLIDVDTTEIFIRDEALANYFEKVASEVREWESASPYPAKKPIIKLAANFIIGDFLRFLNETSSSVKDTLITPENFGEFLTLVAEEKISSSGAKIVFEEMFRTGQDPSLIMQEKNLGEKFDETELMEIIKNVIAANPKAVEDYKKGNSASLQFLTGQIMKESKGRANPKTSQEIIKKIL